jgi:Fe-S cluster assembly scaffold protein SufB
MAKITAKEGMVIEAKPIIELAIPKDKTFVKPIVIKINNNSREILVNAGENSKAAVIESADGDLKVDVEVIAGKNSVIDYASIYGNAQIVKNGTAKENACINWIDIVLGEVNLSVKTKLSEPMASTAKLGAFFNDKMQVSQITAAALHEAKNTNSSIYHKGILTDDAKSVFKANVNVSKNATGSIGKQKAGVLLIGNNASCDAMPILDVNNDDVQCSHGVSVTKLDDEEIFYLMSRGMDEETARSTIISGFIEPVINELKDELLKEKVHSAVSSRLEARK